MRAVRKVGTTKRQLEPDSSTCGSNPTVGDGKLEIGSVASGGSDGVVPSDGKRCQ